MSSPSLKKEPAHGLRIWRIREPASMPVAHIHADLEINIVLEGEPLRYLQGGRILEIPVGRMTMFWGGIPHQLLSPKTAFEGVWLTLPLPWVLLWKLPGDPIHDLLLGEVWVEAEGTDDPRRTLRWVEDFESGNSQRQRVMCLEIEARVYRMLLGRTPGTAWTPIRSDHPGEIRLQEITAYMAKHYTETIKVKDIATAMGLNQRYLMRLFQQCTGFTIWEYILRLRISHAQQQLISSNDKIIDVALNCGFETLSSFYRSFKVYGGCPSPGQFRRQHRASGLF